MPILFNFLSPHTSSSSGIVKSILLIRLTIVSAITILLTYFHTVHQSFDDFQLLLIACACIFMYSLLSIKNQHSLNTKHAIARELVIDLIWVFIIVWFSGRSANPFIYYYLLLTLIAAATLTNKQISVFCLSGIMAYSVLMYVDLNLHFQHMSEAYQMHLLGMWLIYVGSVLSSCFFVSRLSSFMQEQQKQLRKEREQNLKNEQLIGIGTIAASTVHSLASPVSTLALLTDEIREQNTNKTLTEDLNLMLKQIERCKTIMKELSSLAQHNEENKTLKIATLSEHLQDHYSLHYPNNLPVFNYDEKIQHQSIRNSSVLQFALINLINNSLESSNTTSTVDYKIIDEHLALCISNNCKGDENNIRHNWGNPTPSSKENGLGIGSFLANSTIEKLGGHVELNINKQVENPELNTVTVTISLPLS